MNVVDANVLLYAVNEDAVHHEASRSWLDDSLSGARVVGFSWMALLAFLRLATKPGLFARPLTPALALAIVEAWLAQPAAQVLEPTLRHLVVVGRLLEATGVGGNLVNDAHLAALALEHRGVVITYDSDFGRFPDVSWQRPEPRG